MAIETYQFLNNAGIQKLATEVFTKVNTRIDGRIVTEITEASGDKVVPSAKTVYTLLAAINAAADTLKGRVDEHDEALSGHGDSISALQTSQGEQDTKISGLEGDLAALEQTVAGLTHLTIETVTGGIDTIAEPATDKLYMQRDSEEDSTWMLYVYNNGEWINVGDTEVDLSNYWSKDDVDEMREALGIHDAEAIGDDDIVASVTAAFTATEPVLA